VSYRGPSSWCAATDAVISSRSLAFTRTRYVANASRSKEKENIDHPNGSGPAPARPASCSGRPGGGSVLAATPVRPRERGCRAPGADPCLPLGKRAGCRGPYSVPPVAEIHPLSGGAYARDAPSRRCRRRRASGPVQSRLRQGAEVRARCPPLALSSIGGGAWRGEGDSEVVRENLDFHLFCERDGREGSRTAAELADWGDELSSFHLSPWSSDGPGTSG
jgi:hypothetical protein